MPAAQSAMAARLASMPKCLLLLQPHSVLPALGAHPAPGVADAGCSRGVAASEGARLLGCELDRAAA